MATTISDIYVKQADGSMLLAGQAVPNIDQRVRDLEAKLATTTFKTTLLGMIYPVGSIYMSLNNVSPQTFLGGTWEALDDGKVLLGANSTYTAGSTGGATTHKITTAELPAHNHTASTGASGAHTHTASTNSTGAHTHSGGSMQMSANTGVMDICVYKDALHNASLAFVKKDNIRRWFSYDNVAHDLTSVKIDVSDTIALTSAGAHAHTVTVQNSTTHTHTVSVGNTGSGTAMSLMQPYLAVYMWKRIK